LVGHASRRDESSRQFRIVFNRNFPATSSFPENLLVSYLATMTRRVLLAEKRIRLFL
jgi:hypothetical protein